MHTVKQTHSQIVYLYTYYSSNPFNSFIKFIYQSIIHSFNSIQFNSSIHPSITPSIPRTPGTWWQQRGGVGVWGRSWAASSRAHAHAPTPPHTRETSPHSGRHSHRESSTRYSPIRRGWTTCGGRGGREGMNGRWRGQDVEGIGWNGVKSIAQMNRVKKKKVWVSLFWWAFFSLNVPWFLFVVVVNSSFLSWEIWGKSQTNSMTTWKWNLYVHFISTFSLSVYLLNRYFPQQHEEGK